MTGAGVRGVVEAIFPGRQGPKAGTCCICCVEGTTCTAPKCHCHDPDAALAQVRSAVHGLIDAAFDAAVKRVAPKKRKRP